MEKVKVISRIELPKVEVNEYKCCSCKEYKPQGHFRISPEYNPFPECVECEFSFDEDWYVDEKNDFRPLDDL
jgi:hypothetical protein